MTTERYLSPEQVAERYHLPKAWVYRCKALKKYGVRRGKYLRFKESDLEKFEAEMEGATRGYVIRHDDKKFKLRFDIK